MSIYDVAENYPSKDTTLKDGEIVSLDSSQNGPFVKRAQTGETLLGAISKDPAVLLGGFNGQQYKEEHQVAVTLSGRILVDVVLEGEEIKQGDKISLSSIPGIGKKAEGNEQTIGIALEKFDKNSSPEYFLDIENNPNLQGRAEKIREIFGLESGRQIPVAKILVFINLGQSRLTINEEPTVISMQEEIKQMKLDIEEIASSQSSVAGSNQNLIDLVLSYFESLGARITDGVAYFKNLVAETLTIGSREKPTGITLYDEETGEPYCVKIKSGQMVSVPGECRNSEPTSEPTSDIGLDPIPSSSPEPTSTELLEPTLSPEATPSPSITPEPLPDQTATSTNIIL
ncbi:MAG: hypothetical protein ABIJ85_04420 [bacterium]